MSSKGLGVKVTDVLIFAIAATSVALAQSQTALRSPQYSPIPASRPIPIGVVVNHTFTNLSYGSGPVMRNPTNYLIFWQPPGRAAFPAGYQAGIQKFFQDVGGTPFYNIVTQYGDSSGTPVPNAASFGATFTDTTTVAPSGCNGSIGAVGATPNCPLTDADIRAEVSHAIAVNGWPNGGVNNEFFVYTPSDTDECMGPDSKDPSKQDCFAINGGPGPNEIAAFCAYHNFFGTNTIYAYIPFTSNPQAGLTCGGIAPFPTSGAVDIALGSTSHEMIESNTDPLLKAWRGGTGVDAGDEIGDECNQDLGFVAQDGTNLVLNGDRFQIQREWSNAVTGCAKRLDPPASALSLPPMLNFGIHGAGSPPAPLTLPISDGAGPGDLNILFIRLGAASDFRFSIPTIPPTWKTLHAGQTLPETVLFNPVAPPVTAAGTVVIDTDLTTSSADENIVSLAGVVVLAPVITKAFPGPTIPLNTDRNLTFTITNPNTITITGVAFSDALPAGMVVSTPSVVAGTCGAGVITAVAGSSNISLSAGTIAAASSCTFSVSIKDTIPGVATNTTSNVTSNEAGSGNQATATLTIVAPPVITKAFGALSIPVGGSTSLTFTITNPNATVTLTTVAFIDTLPTGLTVSSPNGLTGSCGGTVTALPGTSVVSLAGGTISPTASCTFSVNVTGVSEAIAINSVTVTSVEGGSGNTATAKIAVGGAFQIRYTSNVSVGDSVVNITNTGAGSTVGLPTQNGNLCVNVYTFSPDEQLISCCSCLVTPNGLASLSARNDLISNTLTPAVPTSIVVKLVASGATSCNASTVGSTANPLALGLAAWGTTIHALPGTPAAYGVTETPFTPANLSASELARITALCGFIQANGSGFGICRSCQLGGLGAAAQ
jgi:uncharacterized repeat protein (TIGR01451 family)